MSCIFVSCNFDGHLFSCPSFSVNPLSLKLVIYSLATFEPDSKIYANMPRVTLTIDFLNWKSTHRLLLTVGNVHTNFLRLFVFELGQTDRHVGRCITILVVWVIVSCSYLVQLCSNKHALKHYSNTSCWMLLTQIRPLADIVHSIYAFTFIYLCSGSGFAFARQRHPLIGSETTFGPR